MHGLELILQFDTSRPEGQFRKPASNKKLLSLIGEFEFTPFETGKLHNFEIPRHDDNTYI